MRWQGHRGIRSAMMALPFRSKGKGPSHDIAEGSMEYNSFSVIRLLLRICSAFSHPGRLWSSN